jgi:glycosyltransferase involved in cell wall biosynthesis
MKSAKPNILLWRAWHPLYDSPATFSSLATQSIGGTCCQLLWHARMLAAADHEVTVLGVSYTDCEEEGVRFIGTRNKEDQLKLFSSGSISPQLIFLEGAHDAAEILRQYFPNAIQILVGQNVDELGAKPALAKSSVIDLYAFVSQGHLAEYSYRYPELRHKFVLLRNIVPWEQIHSKVTTLPTKKEIAWVGAWTKRGLRSWAETMSEFMILYPQYHWKLYGPSHGAHIPSDLPNNFTKGLNLPLDRIHVFNLAQEQLLPAISAAQVVLVSLGNETACISALDAHAMGRPVLSGSDMVFFFNNRTATGYRVTSSRQRLQKLIELAENPELADRLGQEGRKLISAEYTEENLSQDMHRILSLYTLTREFDYKMPEESLFGRRISPLLREKLNRIFNS